MKLKNLSLILLIIFLFSSCSTKDSQLLLSNKKVNNNFMNQQKETKKFFDIYFKPWNMKKLSSSKTSAMWGLMYQYRKIYLENHRLASKKWFEKQITNANFDDYNTLLKKAITLKNTNVRVLPTKEPMFYNPLKPGEGFPFDYNQNSLLKINTPLLISHLSKDKAWAFIESNIVSGWVSINKIAFVDELFINTFKTNNYYVAIKEKFPIYDPNFREYIKLATIFPKKNNNFIIAKQDLNKNAIIAFIKLSNQEVKKIPIEFNSKNRIKISKALLNEPYGWGGLLNNRDCSSFTQDFFIPFGKFLSRNSKAQIKNGKYINLSNLSKSQKKQYIRKYAIPFSTLIYLKGHIMLYIGTKNNEPLVMHNIWSIRLKNKQGKEFRHIIGKTSITSLEPGKDLEGFTQSSNLLNKIQGIVIL